MATSRWRRARSALSFSRRQRLEAVEGPGPDRVVLSEALAFPPANHRRAVILHYLAGLSVAEIADESPTAP